MKSTSPIGTTTTFDFNNDIGAVSLGGKELGFRSGGGDPDFRFGGALWAPPDKGRPAGIQINAGIDITALEVHPDKRLAGRLNLLIHRGTI
jgi:hypothetical protein